MVLETNFSTAWAQIRDHLVQPSIQPLLQAIAWAGLIFLGYRVGKAIYAKARGLAAPPGLRWAFLVALIAVTPITAINLSTGLADTFVGWVAQLISPLLPK